MTASFFTSRAARELQNLPLQMRLGLCSGDLFPLDTIVSQMKELLIQAREKSNRTLEKLLKNEEPEETKKSRRDPVDSAGYRVVLGKSAPVRREFQATLTAKVSVVRQKSSPQRRAQRRSGGLRTPATPSPTPSSPIDWQRPQGQRR